MESNPFADIGLVPATAKPLPPPAPPHDPNMGMTAGFPAQVKSIVHHRHTPEYISHTLSSQPLRRVTKPTTAAACFKVATVRSSRLAFPTTRLPQRLSPPHSRGWLCSGAASGLRACPGASVGPVPRSAAAPGPASGPRLV